jgi:hypothetical protein
MAEIVQQGLIRAADVARQTTTRRASNGVVYASFGETQVNDQDLIRMVQAVPSAIAAALDGKAYYFVPLALAEARPDSRPDTRPDSRPEARPDGHRASSEETMIASAYSVELGDEAICHRNVALSAAEGGPVEGVFISTRVLNDRFALAFEFFINVGHAFVDAAGVPEHFAELAWSQVLAGVRGETSQDAFESRNLAFSRKPEAGPRSEERGRSDEKGSRDEKGVGGDKARIDEKARLNFLESTFSDALAIYLLSLAVDFDYSELREREYPLLAPTALADRLRLAAKLFPPNPGYEFSIRYRRRA